MTRSKPWRPDASSTSVQAQTSKVQPDGIATAEQTSPSALSTQANTLNSSVPQVRTDEVDAPQVTSPSAIREDVNNTSAKESEASLPKLKYVPPKVADEEGEDVLHVYHPEDDDYINESQVDEVPEIVDDNATQSTNATQPTNASSQRQHQQQYDRDTQEGHGEDEDLFTTFDRLLTGGSRGHGAGPFGFLDVMASALSDVLPRGFPLGDDGRQHEQPRNVSVSDQPRTASSPPRATSPPRGHFHASSEDIELQEQRYLVARCKDVGGVPLASRLDLNDCLTNNNGHFEWCKAGNFVQSARNVELVEDGQLLKAQLKQCNGAWRSDSIRLPHRISNKYGHLVMVA